MRIRRKPWAKPALEAWPYYIAEPQNQMGHWQEIFEKKQPLWIELGCGKGGFISQIAPRHPEINFLAIDVKPEMLVLAMQKVTHSYSAIQKPPSNVRLLLFEIMLIHQMLCAHDKVERIYINFCNPWYKNRHKARRLTHPNQLRQYKEFLVPKGEIWFKTDHDELFKESIGYFEAEGFQIIHTIADLHKNDSFENFRTEHEEMFSSEGIPIKFLIARKM